MKGKIQALGGFLVCLLLPILIMFAWVDSDLVARILLTDIILIFICLVIDEYIIGN